MSQIIKARERLVQIAKCVACPPNIGRKIRRVIRETMYRDRHAASSGERAIHPMPTPATVLAVRRYKKLHPEMNDGDIGRKFKLVNHGRVSEILYGKKGKAMYDQRGHRIPANGGQ